MYDVTDSNALHAQKACNPIDITDFGIVTSFSCLQLSNAPTPIDKTPSGISSDEIPQPAKADWHISVTPMGMATEVIPLQPKNAVSPMTITEFGMMVFSHPRRSVFDDVWIMALQFSLESNVLFSNATVI